MQTEHDDVDDLVRSLVLAARKRGGFEFVQTREGMCDLHGKFKYDEFRGADGDLTLPVCTICADEAERIKREREAHLDAIEYKRRAIAGKFESACIPPRFADRSLENYRTESDKQEAVLNFCKQYAANFAEVKKQGASIIFSGTVGTGKTHLSIGIANKIIADGHTALFCTAAGIIRRVRSSWGKNDESEVDAMNIFTMPDLLIIDEVGVQAGSDNEHQIMFEILNKRYENCLPSIMLTNLPLQDQTENGIVRKGLKSFVGERLLDRMREGGGKAFTMDWKSGRIGR